MVSDAPRPSNSSTTSRRPLPARSRLGHVRAAQRACLDILGVPVDATDDKGLTAVRMLLGSTLARLFEMSLSRAPVPMGWEDGRGARSVPDTLVLYRKKVDHHRAEIAAGAMQRIAAEAPGGNAARRTRRCGRWPDPEYASAR